MRIQGLAAVIPVAVCLILQPCTPSGRNARLAKKIVTAECGRASPGGTIVQVVLQHSFDNVFTLGRRAADIQLRT